MLKRTQLARQVEPVYSRFIDRYPSLISLKGISFNELQGGYYSHLGLKYSVICFMIQLIFYWTNTMASYQKSLEELMSLPGLSHYSAGAVRVFCMGLS